MNFAKNILYTLIILIAFLGILELSFRSIVYAVRGSEEQYALVVPDSKLGWVHNVNMEKRTRRNRCGEDVVLLASRHKLINKLPRHSGKRTVLFIGDSFTHAQEVSTGRAYYDVFERREGSRYAVYAAGIGGFGSLQEWVVLTSIYDEIRPDIVVWQLHGNDVSNNVYELDNSSFYNNQRRRPYLDPISNEIETRNPGFWLFDWSHGICSAGC